MARKKPGFLGVVITPENRNTVIANFFNVFLKKVNEDEKYQGLTEVEKKELSRVYALMEVNRQKKHYDAWLKGKTFYKYKGKIYPVLTENEFSKNKLFDIIK